jgi:DNA gyrase/topoisomerase IV subunit B
LQRALFDEGYIYVGVPPLYKVCLKFFVTVFIRLDIIKLISWCFY